MKKQLCFKGFDSLIDFDQLKNNFLRKFSSVSKFMFFKNVYFLNLTFVLSYWELFKGFIKKTITLMLLNFKK